MNQSNGSSLNLPITVRSAVTRSAYLKINLTTTFKSWGALFLCAVMIIATYLLRAIDASSCSLIVIWSIALVYLLIVLVTAVYLAYTSKNSSCLLPTLFTFDDESFSTETELMQSKAKFAFKVVAGYYLLFISATSFIAVSQKALSVENAAAFEKLLHDKVKH
ncbi:MAG: hypothetical protein HXS51_02450 [Theionarchaea archaeon]|nr:hypothetical protein [Theionarchaea archaeon]